MDTVCVCVFVVVVAAAAAVGGGDDETDDDDDDVWLLNVPARCKRISGASVSVNYGIYTHIYFSFVK